LGAGFFISKRVHYPRRPGRPAGPEGQIKERSVQRGHHPFTRPARIDARGPARPGGMPGGKNGGHSHAPRLAPPHIPHLIVGPGAALIPLNLAPMGRDLHAQIGAHDGRI